MAEAKPRQRRVELRQQAGTFVQAMQAEQRRADAAEALVAKVRETLAAALAKVDRLVSDAESGSDTDNGRDPVDG